jgi:Tol biopolymer transport system component
MSNDRFDVLDRLAPLFEAPEASFEAFLRRRDRKRRNQRIAAGVVGIVVFVAAVWIVTSVGSPDRSMPAVPGTTGPTPTPPGTDYLIDLNTGEMTPLPKSIAGWGYTVSLDATMVAYFSPDDAGRDQVFIASVDGTDVQQVTHGRRGAAAVDTIGATDLSPDGEALAYSAAVDGDLPQNIFVLDLATGETSQVTNEKPTTLTDLGVGLGLGAAAPQFSPDSASITYAVNRGDGPGIRIVPVTGGKSVLLVGEGKNDVEAWMGTFSPDGAMLAVGCSGRLEGICIADPDGTNLRLLVRGPHWIWPIWSPDGTRIAYNTDDADGSDVKVFVVDVASGETTFVAEGVADDWLDDHTLIVYHPG